MTEKNRMMKTTCVIMFAVIGTTSIVPAVAKAEQPNVLFLIADDLNTALSGFGHRQCKTPNLDRLAERGVKFENMHCQYPVCGASRASIMSGLYPYSNLTLGNAGTLRGSLPNVVTLSQTFRNNGYYAGRISKIYHMRIPFEIIDGTAESDEATILFSDIRSFTDLSEPLSPQELMDFLNDYLKMMNMSIMVNHGFVDKFIGDAVMAIFDKTEQSTNDARNALNAGMGMLQVLGTMNQKRQRQGQVPISIGIGIHTGPVVFGTLGFEERMDSTVLGDAVNLASS